MFILPIKGMIFVKDKYKFSNITLIDENGKKLEFEVIDFFLADEREYAVLMPIVSEEADDIEDEDVESPSEAEDFDEVVIMRVVENDDEITLEDIEDEDEWQRVADAFEGQFEQEEG